MGKATPLLGFQQSTSYGKQEETNADPPCPHLPRSPSRPWLSWGRSAVSVCMQGAALCAAQLCLCAQLPSWPRSAALRDPAAPSPPEPRREALPGGTRESPAAREGGRRNADAARAPGGGARCARRAGRGDVVGAGRAGAVALVAAAAAAAVIVAAAGCPGGSSSNGSGSGGPEESEAAPSAAARGSGGTSSCPAVAGAEAFAVSYRAWRSRPWLGRAECPWGGAEP